MTINEAIGILNELQPEGLVVQSANILNALKLGIEALKEKLEREKGV